MILGKMIDSLIEWYGEGVAYYIISLLGILNILLIISLIGVFVALFKIIFRK